MFSAWKIDAVFNFPKALGCWSEIAVDAVERTNLLFAKDIDLENISEA